MKYLLPLLLILGCDYTPTEHTHPEPDGACITTVEFVDATPPDTESSGGLILPPPETGLSCKDGLTRNVCEESMGDWDFYHYYTCEEFCRKYVIQISNIVAKR